MSIDFEFLEAAGMAFEDFMNTTLTGNEQGECFQNTAEFILMKPEFEGTLVMLCHGMVWNSRDEFYHPHAWLEWGDGVPLCIDPSNGEEHATILLAPMYYTIGRVKDVVRYTEDEVRDRLIETGVYGPWN